MIKAVISQPFDAMIYGAPAALVGEITFEVYDLETGNVVLAASPLAITEPRPGTYVAVRTINEASDSLVGRWMDGLVELGVEEIVVTKYPIPEPGDGIVPTTGDVADVMFPRTKNSGGGFVGAFNETTTPTGERVERLILKAYQDVIDKTGEITNPDLLLTAQNAITYRTGMLIELSSEQINKERYDELKQLFEDTMTVLIEAAGATGTTVLDEQGREANAAAMFSFPEWPRVGEANW